MKTPVEQWIDALLSGEHVQGKGVLHAKDSNESKCCLGVACYIFKDVLGLRVSEKLRHPRGTEQMVEYDAHTGFLPTSVQDYLGLTDWDGSFQVNEAIGEIIPRYRGIMRYLKLGYRLGHFSSLSRLNDSGATFSQIAAVIKLRPKGLFREEK